MDVTTLRVLTKKSKMGFGRRYHDWTVADTLIRNPSYIAWAYYCVPGISFCEEILQELHVEKRIAKPGSDEEAFREYQKAVTKTFSNEERDHHFWQVAKVRKRKAKAALAREIAKTSFSKGELQAMNHGK